jgi:hypothetical protein
LARGDVAHQQPDEQYQHAFQDHGEPDRAVLTYRNLADGQTPFEPQEDGDCQEEAREEHARVKREFAASGPRQGRGDRDDPDQQHVESAATYGRMRVHRAAIGWIGAGHAAVGTISEDRSRTSNSSSQDGGALPGAIQTAPIDSTRVASALHKLRRFPARSLLSPRVGQDLVHHQRVESGGLEVTRWVARMLEPDELLSWRLELVEPALGNLGAGVVVEATLDQIHGQRQLWHLGFAIEIAQFVTNAGMAPMAARSGASAAPTTPNVSENSAIVSPSCLIVMCVRLARFGRARGVEPGKAWVS